MEPPINRSSLTNNDCFDQGNQSMEKTKHMVMITHIYRVKEGGRVSKNLDLTPDKRKTDYWKEKNTIYFF
jgi:hypothetical protein